MSNNTNFVITLFARAARLGQVKRRLAADIGEQLALLTHQFLVEKTLTALSGYEGAELQIWVDDIGNLDYQDPLYPHRECLIAQEGDTLGKRMAIAVRRSIKNGKIPIVIGSDCPPITANYIQEAKLLLESEYDVVIGPAEDGGYVLIGMKQFHSTLFESIDWGTDSVLQQTLAAANKLTLTVAVLETLWDVDRLEDLARLAALGLPHYPKELQRGLATLQLYPEFVEPLQAGRCHVACSDDLKDPGRKSRRSRRNS